jgi:hypothetical protein
MVLVALAFAPGGLCDALYIADLIDIGSDAPGRTRHRNLVFQQRLWVGRNPGPVLGGSTLQVFGAPGFIAGFLAVLVAYFAAW